MSSVKVTVGGWELQFAAAPRGAEGTVNVTAGKAGGATRAYSATWRRDADGLWLELPHGVFGYDLQGERDDDGRLSFRVSRRNGAESWDSVALAHAGEELTAGASGKKKGARVRAQMPGKIIRVMCKEGQTVERDQPLLVMEAMKMENEIRAAQAGKISKLAVTEGQAVETGADLCVIDPS